MPGGSWGYGKAYQGYIRSDTRFWWLVIATRYPLTVVHAPRCGFTSLLGTGKIEYESGWWWDVLPVCVVAAAGSRSSARRVVHWIATKC